MSAKYALIMIEGEKLNESSKYLTIHVSLKLILNDTSCDRNWGNEINIKTT